MSHFEMMIKSAVHFTIALCLALLPAISQAAVRPGTARAPAAINRAAIMLTAPSKVFYQGDGSSLSPELIASFYQIKTQEKALDVGKVIPMHMRPSHSTSEVLVQVADRSLTSLFNSPEVRQSAVGQVATTVEENLKQELVIGGESPKSIQHKLNFTLQAFQAMAHIEYTGFTRASLKYKMSEQRLNLEVSEKIANDKDMVFSHTIAGNQGTSELSMRWTF